MTCITSVRLDGFYVQAAHLPPEIDPGRPVMVTREKRILDLCARSWAKGVRRGMPVKQAKAIVDSGQYVAWSAEPYLAAQEHWLDLAAQFSHQIQCTDQHSAWIDLSAHPRPLEIARLMRETIETKTTLPVRMGCGPNRWLAEVAEQNDDPGTVFADARAFLADLPLDALRCLPAETIERLRFLGYRRVGEIQRLPRTLLLDQFGPDGHRVKEAALGGLSEPLAVDYPKPMLMAERHFEPPLTDRDTVLRAAAVMCHKLGIDLTRTDRMAKNIQLVIGREDLSPLRLQRLYRSGHQSPQQLRQAVIGLVGDRLDADVTFLRLSLPDLAPAVARQHDLTDRIHSSTEVEKAIGFVRHRFGEEALNQASAIEPARRVRVLREWRHATGWT